MYCELRETLCQTPVSTEYFSLILTIYLNIYGAKLC